jgi:hypothetical protein
MGREVHVRIREGVGERLLALLDFIILKRRVCPPFPHSAFFLPHFQKRSLDKLFTAAKIRHKFLEIRIEEYFKNGNRAPKKNLIFGGTGKIIHFFE